MRKISRTLAVLLLFIIPWENFLVLPVVGTISRTFGFVVIALWLVSLVFSDRIRQLHPVHKILIVLLFWQIISLVWAVDSTVGLVRLSTQIQLLALVVLIWDLFEDLSDIQVGFQAYVLGSFVTAGDIIWNYYQEIFYSEFRLSATGFNPNDAGAVVAIGIPIAWYLAARWKDANPILKGVNFVFIPVGIAAILLTGGRAGFISILPGMMYIFYSYERVSVRWRTIAFAALVVLFFFAQNYVPEPTIDRIYSGTIEEVTDISLNDRYIIWGRVYENFRISPIWGYGIGSGPLIVSRAVHNTFFQVGLELGFIGLILLAWLLFRMLQLIRFQPNRAMVDLWRSVLGVLLVIHSLHNWQYRKQTWIMIALLIASASLDAFRRGRPEEDTSAFAAELIAPAEQP